MKNYAKLKREMGKAWNELKSGILGLKIKVIVLNMARLKELIEEL